MSSYQYIYTMRVPIKLYLFLGHLNKGFLFNPIYLLLYVRNISQTTSDSYNN